MKILFIHQNPDRSGSARSLKYLIDEIKNTHEVELACPKGKAFDQFSTSLEAIYELESVPLFGIVSGARLQMLKNILNLRHVRKSNRELDAILEKSKPDIVHLNDITQLSMATHCKRRGYKVVMHARFVTKRNARFFKRILFRIVNRSVDHLICIDGSVSFSMSGVERKSVVYNSYKPTGNTSSTPSDETFRVLFLSNLLIHKGIMDLMNAAKILSDNRNVEISVAGSNVKDKAFYLSPLGRMLDLLSVYPNLEKRIKLFIKKEGISNVKLLGHVSGIADLLRQTDVLVFPAHMNEPSRSVFEAGFYGVPCILSLKDRVEDVVEHGVNGLIVDEKSPQQIAQGILQLEADRELTRKMGLEAKNRFIKMNDAASSAKKVGVIYRNLLNKAS